MPRFASIALAAGLSLLAMSFAWAGEAADAHLTRDPLRQFYARSAYAHGYMHGYEQGFHEADLDIHLGHVAKAVSQCKGYKSAGGYKPEFGDRSFYQLGYRQGFRAAYADGMRGDAFRALESLRRAADGLGGTANGKEFDQAFSAGYDGGYTEALQRPADLDHEQNATSQCLAGRHHTPTYCDNYARGYRLGFADASANPQRTQTAEKK